MDHFFTVDDLFVILEELDKEEAALEDMEEDLEMEASNRRYQEIIQKHRME